MNDPDRGSRARLSRHLTDLSSTPHRWRRWPLIARPHVAIDEPFRVVREVSSASKARSSTSLAMSSDTSRDQPSAVLKATTQRALLYCPEMKLRMIASRSASARSAQLAEVVDDQVDRDVLLIIGNEVHQTQLTRPPPTTVWPLLWGRASR